MGDKAPREKTRMDPLHPRGKCEVLRRRDWNVQGKQKSLKGWRRAAYLGDSSNMHKGKRLTEEGGMGDGGNGRDREFARAREMIKKEPNQGVKIIGGACCEWPGQGGTENRLRKGGKKGGKWRRKKADVMNSIKISKER